MRARKFARRQERPLIQEALRWLAAFALLFVTLTLPDRLGAFTPLAFARLPLELPVLVLALTILSGPAQLIFRVLAAAVLTLMLLFKLANIATYLGFARSFSPFVDGMMLPIVFDTLNKSAGIAAAIGAAFAVVALIALVGAVLMWALGVIGHGARHARLPMGVAAGALAGLTFLPQAAPYVGWNASTFTRDQVVAANRSLRDGPAFQAQLLRDPLAEGPPANLLAGLKGYDVLLIFVESYGRTALDNPAYAPLVRATLEKFTTEVEAKGFAARSAWMASPTFGGASYLAHATALSGLLVDNHQRYLQLLRSDYGTLISDFNTAGWHTVTVVPQITMDWPEADFFKYGKIHSAMNMGYKGQSFEYMTMPDQYSLAAFQRAEIDPTDRKPVMAEIALISSHIPWAPIPKLVPWDDVGDGTIFNTARTPESSHEVWRDPKRVPEYFALSIDYTLQTLMSYVTTFGRDNTLFIILGDHQPMGFIAREYGNHDVPVHIIARDPAVLAALDKGTWAVGMTPDASSPSWPMNTFRQRMLEAFTPPADAASSPLPP
jgi:hypothetical protein